MPATLTNSYANFFDTNPRTAFSQVHGLGWISENPYGETPLGYVVGKTIGGSSDHNANANLWGEGYAGAGIPGVFLVTFLLGGVFYIADWASQGLDRRFVILAFVGHATQLQNTSVFTSFVSGGLALTIILLFLVSPDTEPLRSRFRVNGH